MTNGDFASSALEIGIGSGIALTSVTSGINEVKEYASTMAQSTVKQFQIDEMPK